MKRTLSCRHHAWDLSHSSRSQTSLLGCSTAGCPIRRRTPRVFPTLSTLWRPGGDGIGALYQSQRVRDKKGCDRHLREIEQRFAGLDEFIRTKFMGRNPRAVHPGSIAGVQINQDVIGSFAGDQKVAPRKGVVLDECIGALTLFE